MTTVEYTEQALDHLDGLEPITAERVLEKVEEASEWTEHRLGIEPIRDRQTPCRSPG